MINLFTFAVQDKSISYLTQIFGTMNGIISNPQASGGAVSGASLSLLGTMSKTFNMLLLSVGVLLVIYVTLVGLMQASQDGEFMGKKWSSLWVPFRMAAGIAALVPTGSGYSALQLLMMWVIMQGIGAADNVWSTALNYITVAGSPYANAVIPSANVYNTLSTLFQGMTCDAAAREKRIDPSGLVNGGYYCNPSNQGKSGFCTSSNDFNPLASSYSLGPNAACGTLTYCDQTQACQNPNTLQCIGCKAQITALQGVGGVGIIATLQNMANTFQQTDYSYRDFYANSFNQPNNPSWSWIYDYCNSLSPPVSQNQCCIAPTSPLAKQLIASGSMKVTCQSSTDNTILPFANDTNPQNPTDDAVKLVYWPAAMQPLAGTGNFIDTMTTQYTSVISDAVTTYIKNQANNPNSFSGQLSAANQAGWLMAGSYYYAIAQMNNNNLSAAIPVFSMTTMGISNDSPMSSYRNNYNAANTLINTAADGSSGNTLGPQLASMGGLFSNTMSSVEGGFLNATGQGNVNPLAGIQGLGMGLLITAEILLPIALALALVLGFVSNLNFKYLGTGLWLPIGPALHMVYLIFVPALFAFIVFLIAIGGLLGVYTPLIPYILFTVGSIGWFITIIEAMVAAPFVALGILAPTGEHAFLGQAKPAFLIMASVALRPVLMIFGLMVAMLLAVVAADIVNASFWSVAHSIGTLDPLGFILFFCAYVTLLITVLNKSFSAIYILPQGVMRWIGGQAETYHEAEGLHEFKGGAEGAAGKVGGAIGAGMEAAGEGAQAGGAKEEKRKQHNERVRKEEEEKRKAKLSRVEQPESEEEEEEAEKQEDSGTTGEVLKSQKPPKTEKEEKKKPEGDEKKKGEE